MDILIDLIELLVEGCSELIAKFNYSRKTKKESVIFFSCISVVYLAAIIGFVLWFVHSSSVSFNIPLIFMVLLIVILYLDQLRRFLRRMK